MKLTMYKYFYRSSPVTLFPPNHPYSTARVGFTRFAHWFDLQTFDQYEFSDWLREDNIPLDTTLCMLVRIHSKQENGADRWYMTGRQTPVHFKSYDDPSIPLIIEEELNRIFRKQDEYEVARVVKIEVTLKKLNLDPALRLDRKELKRILPQYNQ